MAALQANFNQVFVFYQYNGQRSTVIVNSVLKGEYPILPIYIQIYNCSLKHKRATQSLDLWLLNNNSRSYFGTKFKEEALFLDEFSYNVENSGIWLLLA